MPKRTRPKPGGRQAGPESFEAALRRLEEIVARLERAEAPLEATLALYEEGVKLTRYCQEQLRAAERKVELLEDKHGELRARPFPVEGTASEADDDTEDGDENEHGEDDEAAEDEGENGGSEDGDDEGETRRGSDTLF